MLLQLLQALTLSFLLMSCFFGVKYVYIYISISIVSQVIINIYIHYKYKTYTYSPTKVLYMCRYYWPCHIVNPPWSFSGFPRGLDLEKLCAQLGQSERGAQGELLRAQEREQLSRVTWKK